MPLALDVMHKRTCARVLVWVALCSSHFLAEASELLYSVVEESKPGTPVGLLCKDLGVDLQSILHRNVHIVSESYAKYFDVDVVSGALVVKQSIDRESICGWSSSCHIRSQILLQNPPEMHQVTVEIADVNDNAPLFRTNGTTLEVSEAAAPGMMFRLESASDKDVGVNSIRSYFLSPDDRFTLKIETKSDGTKVPVLVLNKSLDREKQSAFRLILTAVDGGKPEKSGTTHIFMNVLDVNDNAPGFDKPTKRVTLLENSPVGTFVTSLNASDADHGANGELSYSFDKFTPSHVLKLFSVDSVTGEIRVTGQVDREQAHVYDVTVQARDRGIPAMEGSCSIKIEIVDVNDNTPVINIRSFSHELSEDVNPGTVIAILSIKDDDVGKNGEVTVQIPDELPFKITELYEGHYTLMTDSPLDREAVAEYTIVVRATDSGSPHHSSQESLVVRLSDVNDNMPVFSQPSYSVDIAENNDPNAYLLTVSAFDQDMGENSSLSFSIMDSDVHGNPVSSFVYINTEKGYIYAMREFDYEQIKVFQIVVQVCDQGSPVHSSTATVHVFIIDQNDHSPRLLYPALPPEGMLQFLVTSNVGNGHVVNRIICIDEDSGHNAWLFYSLSGPHAALFHIGAHTGELRTARKLVQDECKGVLSLVVVVQDNGKPALTTTVAVNVTVSEKATDASSENRSSPSRRTNGSSDFVLYLIVVLSCIIAVSLLAITVVAVRWLWHHGHLTCLMHRLGFRRALQQHQHKDFHLQLNTDGPIRYLEVVGGSQDPPNASPCFSTISSRSDFVFVKTPNGALSTSLSRRLFSSSFKKVRVQYVHSHISIEFPKHGTSCIYNI